MVGEAAGFEFRIASFTECVNGEARVVVEGDQQFFEWRFNPNQLALNANSAY